MQTHNFLRVVPPSRRHARVRITIGLLTVFLFGIFSPYLTLSSLAAPGDETTYYFINDHLGSVDVVLDDKGNVVERRDFLPYGSERVTDPADPSTSTNHKFTGKEMDDETGLMYYGARYYDPVIGRFISQDPLLLEMDRMSLQERNKFLSDPQNLNAYSYARNNPLRYVDPDGKVAESAVDVALTVYDATKVFFNIIQNAGEGYIQLYATIVDDEELQDASYQAIQQNWQDLKGASADVTIDAVAAAIPFVPAVISKIDNVDDAYDIAKNGGKHSGFLKDYIQKTTKEIEKGVNSFKKQISNHTDKLNAPSKYVNDWSTRTNQYKEGLMKKWQNEIAGFKEQKSILEDIIKEKK